MVRQPRRLRLSDDAGEVRRVPGFAEAVIMVLNVALATLLAARESFRSTRPRVFAAMITVYFIESFAFAASLANDILSIALAVIWGAALGSWLRGRAVTEDRALKAVRWFALYSALPAGSFLALPVSAALGGWRIADPETGARFGIPRPVPRPVEKYFLTTGVARMLFRRAEQR
jgi:hypothetical protein